MSIFYNCNIFWTLKYYKLLIVERLLQLKYHQNGFAPFLICFLVLSLVKLYIFMIILIVYEKLIKIRILISINFWKRLSTTIFSYYQLNSSTNYSTSPTAIDF